MAAINARSGINSCINLGQGDFIVLNGVINAQLSAVDLLFDLF